MKAIVRYTKENKDIQGNVISNDYVYSSPSITNSFPHFPLLPFIQTLSHNIV